MRSRIYLTDSREREREREGGIKAHVDLLSLKEEVEEYATSVSCYLTHLRQQDHMLKFFLLSQQSYSGRGWGGRERETEKEDERERDGVKCHRRGEESRAGRGFQREGL